MVSVKAYLNDGNSKNMKLIRELERELPYVYRNKYLANSRIMAPVVTGRLRKSIGSQIMGNKLTIVWRVPYAKAVDEGGHTDKTTHFAPAKGFGAGGKGYMTRPGWFHPYRTGSKGFANRISRQTNADMDEYFKSKGL